MHDRSVVALKSFAPYSETPGQERHSQHIQLHCFVGNCFPSEPLDGTIRMLVAQQLLRCPVAQMHYLRTDSLVFKHLHQAYEARIFQAQQKQV